MRLVSYLTPSIPVAFFDAIASALDAELVLDQTKSGPEPDSNPLTDGRADLAWVCSTSFVELSDVQLGGVAWVPDDPDAAGRPVYFSDVVVADHFRAERLEDLRGARIGVNDPKSLSGYHALRFEMLRRNERAAEFADLAFTGGHHVSLEALLAGRLDAACVDSVALRALGAAGSEAAGLRVIDRLGPWPTQPLIASASLSATDLEEVQRRILSLNNEAAMLTLFQQAAIERFALVGSDHCDVVAAAATG